MADSSSPVPLLGLLPLLLTVPIPSEGGKDAPLLNFGPTTLEMGMWLMLAALFGVLGCLYIASGGRGKFAAEVCSLWLAAPLACLVFLKLFDSGEQHFFAWKSALLFVFVPLWVGDSLAYFLGKKFGKRLLAPKISPKKTVVGASANFIGCLVAAVAVSSLLGWPTFVGVLCGLAAGVLGQLGDLLESAMKRARGLKDSGNLLPGHGGLLDRIDSILLTAPVVAIIVSAYIPVAR